MNSANKVILLSEETVAAHAGERLDVFLTSALERSRSVVQSQIKSGLVTLTPATAKAQASYRLKTGDAIEVRPGEIVPQPDEPQGESIPLDILYEDEALLALNKQAGLVVHPAAGHWSGTLVNALIHHRGDQLAMQGGQERSGLVHRLDKDTSGLILIAKTNEVHAKLAEAFAGRTVKKIYRALCWGTFARPTGECRGPIGRHPIHRKKMAVMKNAGRGRPAWTDYRVVAQGKTGAETECLLHTGRTHQIRVHLSYLGHPIWGDPVYGRPHILADGFTPARQMLHAAHLEVAHPLTGKPLVLDAPLPADYIDARERLLKK